MLNQKIILKKAIGKGGFGTVYLAEVQDFQGFRKHVAIKQLNPQLATSNQALARQLAEARLLGLLNHEHIVQVYDLGFLDGKLSICLEYIEGVSLSQLLQACIIPLRAVLEIIGDCADALDSAYNTQHLSTKERLEVIHRDIKPANILLSKTGCTKLLDFGIAKGNYDRGIITSNQQIGTRRYMAPEQWLHNQVSEKVDIYALGFTFLELLHQKLLPRLALDEDLFHEQLQDLIEGIAFPDEIQDSLRELLYGMLAFNPTERPSALIVKQLSFQLMEKLSGQALSLFAQETIPELFLNQLESFSDLPIPTDSLTFTQLQSIPKEPLSPQIPPPPQQKQSYKRPLFLLSLCLLAFFLYNTSPAPSESSLVKPPVQNKKIPPTESKTPWPEIAEENTPAVVLAPKIKTKAPRKRKTTQPKKEAVYFETSFSSIPLGADIFLDGKHIGKTMLLKMRIAEGKHQIKMVLGEDSIEKELLIQHPTRFVWKIGKQGDEQWLSFLD